MGRKEHGLRQLARDIRVAEEKAFGEESFEEDVSVPDETAEDPEFEDFVQPLRFKVRKKAVKDFLAELDELRREVIKRYSKELKSEDDIWPRNWMENSVKIMANLDKKKNRSFIPLMNYLCKNKLDAPKCRGVMGKLKVRKFEIKAESGEVNSYDYVLLKPLNEGRKKDITEVLGVGVDTLREYINEMLRWGILKDLGKYGSNDPYIYAIGYWSHWQGNKVKPVWFLKDTPEMRQALKEFDVRKKI